MFDKGSHRCAVAVLSTALSAIALPGCERKELHAATDVAKNLALYEGKRIHVLGQRVAEPRIVTLTLENGRLETFAEIGLISTSDETLPTYLHLHPGERNHLSADYLLRAQPRASISPNGEVRAEIVIDKGRAFMLQK